MKDTKRIYYGRIKRLSAGTLEIKPHAVILKTETTIVQEDAIFYRNFLGKIINFDYYTVLPTYDEALDYVQQVKNQNPNSGAANCLYFDSNDLLPEDISKERFKQLKKEYKEARKK